MVFTDNHFIIDDMIIAVDGFSVHLTNWTKFLDVFIDYKLNWKKHIPYINDKVSVTSRVRCEEWPTLVLGCIWGLFVKYQNSPEKIKRHITNTDKIQQNAQSFYIAHTLIYSFIHSLVHSFIPITHHTIHASPMHHPFITHCIILCITHSSHCPTHHTMHHPFVTLHLNTSYQ